VLGNHDRPRLVSRIGPAQARVAAILLLTLRGTPTLYYGDEIGMKQVAIPPGALRDPFEKNCSWDRHRSGRMPDPDAMGFL
jgi:alpha-glucosidase